MVRKAVKELTPRDPLGHIQPDHVHSGVNRLGYHSTDRQDWKLCSLGLTPGARGAHLYFWNL